MRSVFSATLIRSGKQTGLRAGLQGCRAGRGWSLPLTSQRSQPHLLNPGCSQLPEPWSLEQLSPCPSWDASIRPRPEGWIATSVQGRLVTLTPQLLGPSWILSLTAGARGIRRGCGGQVGAWLESQLPILSSWDKILPSLPLKSAHLPT